MGINNAFKNFFPLRFSACPLCHLCNLLLSPQEQWWSIVIRDVPDIRFRFRLAGYPAIFCYPVPVPDPTKILPVAG